MKLTISRKALADLMAKGGSAAAKNSPVPIIGHARLVAKAGVLRVSTTDFEMQAEAFAEAAVEVEGAATVSAEKLTQIVGRLPPDASISFSLEGTDVVLKASPGRTRLKLATLPLDLWPALDFKADGAAVFDLTGGELTRLFARTYESAKVNNNSTTIASVFLHLRDWRGTPSLAAVGTNGHICVVTAVALPEGAEAMPERNGRAGVLLSFETVAAALRLFKGAEKVRIRVTDRVIALEDGHARLISKLIDATYPDYQRIIPTPTATRAVVNRARGLSVVTLLESFSAKDQGHKLECGAGTDGLIVAASEVGGEGFDQVEATIEGDVAPFGVSSLYLKLMLSAYGTERVALSFGGLGGPILVSADDEPDTLGVLMPMRVAGDLVRRLTA